MPHESSRKANAGFEIDLSKALPWVLTYALEPPKESQREGLAKAQREKVEIENARRRGELIPTWDVEDVLSALGVAVNTRIDSVPGRVANEFAAERNAAVIFQRTTDELRPIKAVFAETARKLSIAFRDLAEGSESGGPAAEAERSAVGGSESNPAAG